MIADYDRAVVTDPVDLLLADGALVALVWMVPHPDHLLIENLATAPEYQGRGYGRRLLAHAETFAAKLGLPETRLYTNRLFTANVELYLRCGYRIDREEAFWAGSRFTCASLPLRQRQLDAQEGECRGEAPAQPGQHPGTPQDVCAHRRGADRVADEDDERRRHEHGTEFEHPQQWLRLGRVDELRQERQEEDRQLGIEQVELDGLDDYPERRFGRMIGLYPQRSVLLQRTPSHPQEIGDTQELQHLEGDQAGLQERREPEHRGHQVRHDAERAADSRHHRRTRPACTSRRQSVAHAHAGRDHDDQCGQQELNAPGQ